MASKPPEATRTAWNRFALQALRRPRPRDTSVSISILQNSKTIHVLLKPHSLWSLVMQPQQRDTGWSWAQVSLRPCVPVVVGRLELSKDLSGSNMTASISETLPTNPANCTGL